MDICRYNIWVYKLEKKLPSETLFISEINRTFEYIFKISTKMKQKFLKCNFFRGNEHIGHGE